MRPDYPIQYGFAVFALTDLKVRSINRSGYVITLGVNQIGPMFLARYLSTDDETCLIFSTTACVFLLLLKAYGTQVIRGIFKSRNGHQTGLPRRQAPAAPVSRLMAGRGPVGPAGSSAW